MRLRMTEIVPTYFYYGLEDTQKDYENVKSVIESYTNCGGEFDLSWFTFEWYCKMLPVYTDLKEGYIDVFEGVDLYQKVNLGWTSYELFYVIGDAVKDAMYDNSYGSDYGDTEGCWFDKED